MSDFLRSAKLSPIEFEREVKLMLEHCGHILHDFTATHRERLPASEGNYEIDVSVRFKALGVSFLVLVECKYQKKPIEREAVQILADRIRALGAHKGMLIASASFQKGAIEYAVRHGIALIRIVEGQSLYVTRSSEGRTSTNHPLNKPVCMQVQLYGGKNAYINLQESPTVIQEFLKLSIGNIVLSKMLRL